MADVNMETIVDSLSNLTVSNNTIILDNSGNGMMQFWGITTSLLTTATISGNVVGTANPSVTNNASGSGLTMFNNMNSDGTPIAGLNNQ